MTTDSFRGLLDRRKELEKAVERLLSSESNGRLTVTDETASVDFKEEAGRRSGGLLEPGRMKNAQAATHLADEVACMANTPRGGALILGVEDKTGLLLGTELDTDWLRERIHSQIGVAPDIVEQFVGGQRLLIIYVAESPEPVHDTGDRLRWRVGDKCLPVDRSEWWQHRSSALALDPMAVASQSTLTDVRPGAVSAIQEYSEGLRDLSSEDALRRIGALRSDGFLTQAGQLLLCTSQQNYLELTVLDVPGGRVLNRISPQPPASLLEQLREIETSLEAINELVTLDRGLSHTSVRQVPQAAVREAMLNGIIHRDWNRSGPTELRWYSLDATFEVRSPGGFPSGITKDNVLSQCNARYPALADLFRALGLVEKQGLGVDRMYQAMISLGHRPPTITEGAGPAVTTMLMGGPPVAPIMELVAGVRPTVRQRDARVSIILHTLLHQPFITLDSAAENLQTTLESAEIAIEATAQSTFEDEPLIRPYKDVWLLGKTAWDFAVSSRTELSRYLKHAGAGDALQLATDAWLACFGNITSGDLVELTGVSRGTSQAFLQDADGDTLRRVGRGRSTRYVPIQNADDS